MLRTISTRGNVLSLKFLQRKHVPPFPSNLFTRNTVANTVREGPSSQKSQNVLWSKILETHANRLSSQGLVAQPTGSFKNQTNHVSFQFRVILGTACPMLYGSWGLLLPPPNHVERDSITRSMQSNDIQRLIAHVVCLEWTSSEASLPPFNSGTWKPSPMKELPASSESKRREAHHAAGCWAQTESAPETIGSFFRRKKKSSLYGPYLPGTFHCMEVLGGTGYGSYEKEKHLGQKLQGECHKRNADIQDGGKLGGRCPRWKMGDRGRIGRPCNNSVKKKMKKKKLVHSWKQNVAKHGWGLRKPSEEYMW